jgi:hypothetical protein
MADFSLIFFFKLCIGQSSVKEKFYISENKLRGGVSRHKYLYYVATVHSALIAFCYTMIRVGLHVWNQVAYPWLNYKYSNSCQFQLVTLLLLNLCHCWKCFFLFFLLICYLKIIRHLIGWLCLKCSYFIFIYIHHVNLYKYKILWRTALHTWSGDKYHKKVSLEIWIVL